MTARAARRRHPRYGMRHASGSPSPGTPTPQPEALSRERYPAVHGSVPGGLQSSPLAVCPPVAPRRTERRRTGLPRRTDLRPDRPFSYRSLSASDANVSPLRPALQGPEGFGGAAAGVVALPAGPPGPAKGLWSLSPANPLGLHARFVLSALESIVWARSVRAHR